MSLEVDFRSFSQLSRFFLLVDRAKTGTRAQLPRGIGRTPGTFTNIAHHDLYNLAACIRIINCKENCRKRQETTQFQHGKRVVRSWLVVEEAEELSRDGKPLKQAERVPRGSGLLSSRSRKLRIGKKMWSNGHQATPSEVIRSLELRILSTWDTSGPRQVSFSVINCTVW